MGKPTDRNNCPRCAPLYPCQEHAQEGEISAQQLLDALANPGQGLAGQPRGVSRWECHDMN